MAANTKPRPNRGSLRTYKVPAGKIQAAATARMTPEQIAREKRTSEGDYWRTGYLVPTNRNGALR